MYVRTLLIDPQKLPLTVDAWTALESEVWIVKSRLSFPSSVITNISENSRLLKYDPVWMMPATRRASITAQAFEDVLASAETLSYCWRPNHALVFDNWRVLHARPSECAAGDNSRILERVQVVVED